MCDGSKGNTIFTTYVSDGTFGISFATLRILNSRRPRRKFEFGVINYRLVVLGFGFLPLAFPAADRRLYACRVVRHVYDTFPAPHYNVQNRRREKRNKRCVDDDLRTINESSID